MSMTDWFLAGGLVLTIGGFVGSVFHYFLSKEDAAQQREMEANKASFLKEIETLRTASVKENEDRVKINAMLFAKHDSDVDQLQILKGRIDRNHYERTELDAKFDKLENTMATGFNMLSQKFDQLGCGRLNKKSCEVD